MDEHILLERNLVCRELVMSSLAVLVGFREVCPYDGTPLLLQLTLGTFEGTGACVVCQKRFRARYEPGSAAHIPAHWHEDARAAITALEEISRRLGEELNLVSLAEIPQAPAT